jgi:AcrR family transcriptional regulator
MSRTKSATPPNQKAVITRRDRALETRRRVLRGAYRLFCDQGYSATTMVAIAEEAGVAVQTLYFTFDSKAAILSEVLGAAVLGFDEWKGPVPSEVSGAALLELHSWFRAMQQEPDARRALRRFIAGSMEPLTRTAPLVVAMHAAASEPAVRAAIELGEQNRLESWAAVVRMLATKRGGLRKGLTVARGLDILLVVLSNDTVHALKARGWTDAQIRRWLEDVLSQQLLAEP